MNFDNLEKSEQLQKFVNHFPDDRKVKSFKSQIKMARVIASNVMFKLHDLQYFTSLRQHNFCKVQRKFDLNDCFDEIREIMKVKADIKNLLFIFNCDSGENRNKRDTLSTALPRLVIGDEQRVKQVALNVLENAVAYTFEGYIKVSVRYNFQKQHIFFTCKDSGLGIDQKKQEHLFQQLNPIDRLANLKDKLEEEDNVDKQSMGLGLNICRDILKRYNGSINFESSLDTGSTFFFNMELENAVSEEEIQRAGPQNFDQLWSVADNLNAEKKEDSEDAVSKILE